MSRVTFKPGAALTAMLAVTLAGCGSDSAPAVPIVSVPPTTPTPAPTPTPTPTPTPAPTSVEREILPAATSALITTNLSGHYAINPSPAVAARGKLLVMLPGTGAVPRFYRQILRVGAARGHHSIGLTYPNDDAVGDLCGASAAPDCPALARREIITGADMSPLVTVNAANSINGRLAALIQHLNGLYPTEGWGQYLAGGVPDWSRISVAGHSQGSGHAAFMGKIVTLDRVVMFSGPGDFVGAALAPWLSQPGLTPVARYYGFTHSADELVPQSLILAAWAALGLGAAGAPVNIDGVAAPYAGSRQLLTSAPPNLAVFNAAPRHSATIVDAITPVTATGAFVYQPVWEYMAFD